MTLGFGESWQGYGSGSDLTSRGYTVTNSSFVNIDTTGGRWGDKALKLTARSTGGLPRIVRPIQSVLTGTRARLAFWIKTTPNFVASEWSTSGSQFLSLQNSTDTSMLDVTLSTSGILMVTRTETGRGALRNFCLFSISKINDGQWHHVEINIVFGTSTGVGDLWIDGELEHAITNEDTQDGTNNTSTYTHIAFAACRLDDAAGSELWLGPVLYWNDAGTTFTGALPNHSHRIVGLFSNASGNFTQFTPSAGSNFETVDELSNDGDTTYNETSTAANKDTFNFENVPTTTSSVRGVILSSSARSTANTPTFRQMARIAGTNYFLSNKTTSTTYQTFEDIYEVSPATSAAWTATEVNGSEFGYEAVSGVDPLRVTRVLAEVIIDETGSDVVRITQAYVEAVIEGVFVEPPANRTVSTIIVCA